MSLLFAVLIIGNDESGSFHMPHISPGQERRHNLFRILVVDDDYGTARFFKETLQESGYEVDLYTNPNKVLSEFKAHVYDLALIDIRMPSLDGFELYTKLRQID